MHFLMPVHRVNSLKLAKISQHSRRTMKRSVQTPPMLKRKVNIRGRRKKTPDVAVADTVSLLHGSALNRQIPSIRR